MSDFENQIKEILKKEVSKPSKYEYAINNAFLHKSKTNYTKSFYKIVTIACCSIFAVTGIVAATYTIFEIWKEPTKIDTSEYIEKTEGENTWHEPVTDENVKSIIINYLNILGIDNLSTTILEKGNNLPESDEEFYLLRTNEDYNKGLLIYTDINAENITYFVDNEFNKNLKYDEISQELAIEKSKDLFKKLNIWNDDYELQNCDNNNNIWTISFYRNKNKFDCYDITFGIINSKISIQIIHNEKNNNYISSAENISKEEAIKIVDAKEKEFSDIEFSITSCEQSIEKMNAYIYKLENNVKMVDAGIDNDIYQVDDISRNVWVIKVEHKKDNPFLEFDNTENYKRYSNKYYYVDIETGEIIGGAYAFSEE